MHAIKLAQIVITAVRAFLAWRAAVDSKKATQVTSKASVVSAQAEVTAARVLEAASKTSGALYEKGHKLHTQSQEKAVLVENLTGWGPSVVRKEQ